MAGLVPGETARLLLVSAGEALRDEIAGALAAGRAGDHRLYWVSQPALALTRARDLEPHAIIIDDQVENPGPVELTAQIISDIPQAAILILIQPEAMSIARGAILAGARGFVTKPLDSDELVTALRQVLARRPTPVEPAEAGVPTGRVIVFCAPKGGTGRTTLAINTAISLRKGVGEPVVLVDADYAAPAIDVALNLRGERDISDLRPKISQLDRDLVASVLARHESGIDVLLAPPPADLTAPFSLPQVQQVLVWLKRMYPWVVIDLGLPLDETAFAFLDSADLICMSVLPEMIGLRNTRLMFDQLLARGYPEESVWLILNRSGLPGGVPVAVLEEWLGRKVRYQVPNDQELATDTVNRGVPVVLSHRRSPVAKAFYGLGMEIARALPSEGKAFAPVEVVARPAREPVRARPLRRVALAGALGVLVILLLVGVALPRVLQPPHADQRASASASITPAALVPRADSAGGSGGTNPQSGAPGGTPVAETPGSEGTAGGTAPTVAPPPTETKPPTATPSATPTPSPTPSATPTPTWTATLPPTDTPTAEPTPTETPLPTATPSPPRPTATRTRVPPSPTPVLAAAALLEPAPGVSQTGRVTFRWQPGGTLPAGTAYEVVMWNTGEDPASARGIAAPTTEASVIADLDAIYGLGLIKGGEAFWTVIVVQREPYVRLSQPAASNSRILFYQPPAAPGGGPVPTPPKPRD